MRHLIHRTNLLAVTAFVAAACGGAGDPSAGLCSKNGVTSPIVRNHPNGFHTLAIPASDVRVGRELTYDIQGNNTGHGHTVTLTPQNFAAVDAGSEVTLESSDTGAVGRDHTHTVVLNCTET